MRHRTAMDRMKNGDDLRDSDGPQATGLVRRNFGPRQIRTRDEIKVGEVIISWTQNVPAWVRVISEPKQERDKTWSITVESAFGSPGRSIIYLCDSNVEPYAHGRWNWHANFLERLEEPFVDNRMRGEQHDLE